MSNWVQRFESYMLGMGYKPKDLAKKLERKLNSVEVSIYNTKKGNIPDTFKLAIITYEEMLERGRIIYDNPKE